MKKLVLAVAAWALAALSPVVQAEDSHLKSILSSGVLRFGTTGDWNPMSVRDTASGGYKGFDIDIATELAKDMGVKLEFVPTDWKTLVNGVVANKYDLTSSASLNPKRAKVAGYTDSYFSVATVPLTRKEIGAKFNDWDDINSSGVTVAVTLGTVQEAMAREFFPDATIRSIEAPARDYQEVLSKRADVHITSNVEAATLVAKFEQLVVVPVSQPRRPTPLAMLAAQDDQVWLNYLNHWIKLKRARGFFGKLAEKWKLAGR